MKTKFSFSAQALAYNNARLTNQIFKLLPMYENEEDWQKQRDTIALELKGYQGALKDSPDFMVLISKLSALDFAENKVIFRKIVFEAITSLKETMV